MRAAPGGTIGGIMVGAAWFDWDGEEDANLPSRLAAYDPLHDLSYAAYLQGEAQDAMAAATRPVLEREQFQVDFTRWSAKGREPSTPTARQLETAHQLAKDLLVHAVDSLSRGTIQDYDWIDQLPIFDDLVTAFASHDMEVMRAGFTPFGVNDFGSGQKDRQSATASGGGAIVSSGVSSPTVSDSPVARPHGEIQPLRLAPPQFGNGSSIGSNSSLSLITTMSGGSGGSGGGDAPIAVSDYYASLHDEVLTVSSANGVLWNDYLGGGATVSNVSTPSNGAFNYFSADGAFEYDPPANWKGTATFSYSISNAYGTSDPVTSYIAITNTAPATGADTYAAITNTELEIPSSRWPLYDGLLANDTDGDGDDLAVSYCGDPEHGTIVSIETDGSFTYMPETDYVGQDSFTYRITDGVDQSPEQLVTIQVSQPLVDMDTDSDNNGNIEGSTAEDLIETTFPGKIVELNSDDDNDNLIRDLDESPMLLWGYPYEEMDLVQMEVDVEVPLPQTEGFQFQFDIFNPGVALWRDVFKQEAITESDVFIIGTDDIPNIVYVEGISVNNSMVKGILKNTAGTIVNQDSVLFSVVEVDIDTDSDNTGDVSGSDTEDLLEDRPGDGISEVGARIFANRDDDNENGKVDEDDTNIDYANGSVDKDLTQIKLSAQGTYGLNGYWLWLGVENGLKAYADNKKLLLANSGNAPQDWENRPEDLDGYDNQSDTWYGWMVGGTAFPTELFIEGLGKNGISSHCEHVHWRLVKPGATHNDLLSGSMLAGDTVEINVEKIVWPSNENETANANDPLNWASHASETWNGFEIADAWRVEESLSHIINGSTGWIRTHYPQEKEDVILGDGGTYLAPMGQESHKDQPASSTREYANGFTMLVDFEFDGPEYVETWQRYAYSERDNDESASFFRNSGIYIYDHYEIQIFDTDALLNVLNSQDLSTYIVDVDGASRGIRGEVATGNVSLYHELGPDQSPKFWDRSEPVNSAISGVPYKQSIHSTLQDLTTAANIVNQGTNTLEIVATPINPNNLADGVHLVVTLNNTETWNGAVFTGTGTGKYPGATTRVYLQSHWGSGVKFTSATITPIEE